MSVRLSKPDLDSLTGVDEVISRGDRTAYLGLIQRIIADPWGETAETVIKLYRRRVETDDPEFHAAPQYEAAYRLVQALRELR
ncbi:hypothetical protein TspCOW1_21640 [Thiohalobacter sp. COW1]|uniref:hypothetical protein n=1 Tax=Thiohalobacter sp. COW1 TaxID=2795687 RepID=UPI001915D77C|nr:hypothetical protein [Thiohalobacter sp. COW1]BCO32061.1 hypothetical protein TspCOW1_21640 [Thiohalobacter sp. COW1]